MKHSKSQSNVGSINLAAQALGRLGGRSTSPAKIAAARINALKAAAARRKIAKPLQTLSETSAKDS